MKAATKYMAAGGILICAAALAWFTLPLESEARGKALYQANCASCHGADLEGQPDWRKRNENGRLPAPPHDASGHTWHHSDQLLIDLTLQGMEFIAGTSYQTDMPAFKDVLSREEVIEILDYIKSTWPEEIRKRQDRLNQKN